MATHQQVVDALNKAWDALWASVSNHNQLITYRETQVHIEFAHLLLQELDKSGLVRWTDFRIYFDTPHSLRSTGVIDWSLVARLRPDILIRPGAEPRDGRGQRGLAIEIKCFRSLQDNIDDEAGTLEVCDLPKQIRLWKKDLEKLQAVANSFGANRHSKSHLPVH